MNRKIAVFNDLSGLGRCSLVAAISVLTAMGSQPCPVPTAILTAQTGYSSYFLDDYTDRMKHFRTEWEKLNISFDGIYTGYLAHESQLHEIFRFLDVFRQPHTFLLADPVMGDDCKPYDTFTPDLLAGMKQLTAAADIITPNLTEFALLTDSDYSLLRKLSDARQPDRLNDRLRQLADQYYFQNPNGPSEIVITGIHLDSSADLGNQTHAVVSPCASTVSAPPAQIGNLYLNRTQSELICFPRIGGSYSGTGDLFASCLAGGRMLGIPTPEMIRKAGAFLLCALQDTLENHISPNDGIEYEPYLSMLTPSHNN